MSNLIDDSKMCLNEEFNHEKFLNEDCYHYVRAIDSINATKSKFDVAEKTQGQVNKINKPILVVSETNDNLLNFIKNIAMISNFPLIKIITLSISSSVIIKH